MAKAFWGVRLNTGIEVPRDTAVAAVGMGVVLADHTARGGARYKKCRAAS